MKKFLLMLGTVIGIMGSVFEASAEVAHCVPVSDHGSWCEQCENGYSPNDYGNKCVICDVPNCARCSNDHVCSYCAGGYYKDGNGCKPLPHGCNGYSPSTGKCYGCEIGYELKENGTCKESVHCKNIGLQDIINYCNECESGYKRLNGKCVPMEQDCPEGYTLGYNSGKKNYYCENVNCSAHYGGGACARCSNGYVLENFDCVQSCSEGYELRGSGSYIYCVPVGCSDVDYYSCRGCSSGYYYEDGKCVSECKDGYIKGKTNRGHDACFPSEMGCGYNQKIVNGQCVTRSSGDDCGDGYEDENGMCVGISKCEAGFEKVDGECVGKLRYTIPEADEATSNDNENMIEWIFE